MWSRVVRWVAELFPSDAIVQAADGREYMRRYYLLRTRSGRHCRIHEVMLDDEDRYLHDHPWSFTSVILSGGYTETLPDRVRTVTAPFVVRRRASDLHALALNGRTAWTFVVTGPKVREWGFQTESGWIPWWEYQAANYVTEERPGRLFGRRPRQAEQVPASKM